MIFLYTSPSLNFGRFDHHFSSEPLERYFIMEYTTNLNE